MEIKDTEYSKLLKHVDDLKVACENLKLNVRLLEIPIQQSLSKNFLNIDDMECDSSMSSQDSSENWLP